MPISISVRNRPFCTGTHIKTHLPYSPYSVEVFVTEVKVGDVTFSLENSSDLTTTLDLERGCVTLRSSECAYRLSHEGNEIVLYDQKRKRERRVASDAASFPRKEIPRISFGCHKKQDAISIAKRKQIDEYLPLIYHLGKTFQKGTVPCEGIGALLFDIEQAISDKNRESLQMLWDRFFTASGAS